MDHAFVTCTFLWICGILYNMQNHDYANTTAPFKSLVYQNVLASPADTSGFTLEGRAKIEFPNRRLRISSVIDPEFGQAANYVYWCDRVLTL